MSYADPLEAAAAQVLGRLLIGASRLDLALQVYVAALPGAPAHDGHARIERLLELADTLADKSLRADFLRWIVRVRDLEPLTRAVRSGCWLPDPRRNVVLLLASGRPHYTVEELAQAADMQHALLAELQRLCMLERGLTAASAAAFLATQPLDVVEAP